MLRPYSLKFHRIFRVQSFVNYIVLYVLCKPHLANSFSSALVPLKYKHLIDDVDPPYVLDPLSEMYSICKGLSKDQLKVIRRAVINNNRIRELCNGTIKPVLYDEIVEIDKNLAKYIKIFCKELYDNSINRAAFYNTYGSVAQYYKFLVGRSMTCRVCGINSVLTKFHSKRKALDHFFPRHKFPFSAVNFKNLVPMCDTCNSTYKGIQNPILDDTHTKTRAFYPFRSSIPDIKIQITFSKVYSNNIAPTDIELQLTCDNYEQEIASWDRLFGIKENYLAVCCSEEMYTFYNEKYLAYEIHKYSEEEYFEMLENNRLTDMNFLRLPFLKAVS